MKDHPSHVLLIFVFLCWTPQAFCTDSISIVKRIGLKLHHGFVIIHSRDLRPIGNSYPTGVELNWSWQRVHKKAWESCHCYPRIGISTTFWNYDNPEVLGHGINSLFYLEPVFAARNKVSFSIRAAMGLSYQSKPYDEASNPNNLSYSTQFAFPLQVGASAHIRINPKWYVDVSGMYNHISNGGIKQPNKGINWPTAAIGVGRFLHPPNFPLRIKNHWRDQQDPAKRFDVNVFFAFKDWKSNNAFHLSPGVEVKWSKQIARVSALTYGFEWMYDFSDQTEIQDAGLSKSAQKAGLALGHEFLLGQFLFGQQFGYYFFKPFDDGDIFYQRYSLVYRVSQKIALGIALKSHGHVADFLDVRLGYTFAR